jgi:hypothetical protein
VLSASLGLSYLARSLAALVLDVIFGNYTLTYIYLVVSFISFFHLLPLSSFFFLITLLLISFLPLLFFLLLFIVNNHPASLIFPLSLYPGLLHIPLIPFVTRTFFLAAPSALCPSHVSYIRSISILCTTPTPLAPPPPPPPLALNEMNQWRFFFPVFLLCD